MATYTDNYHLSKPETTDSQQSFMEDYATNMDIIDENMGGGGGGGGGHVIIDENGIEVAQEPNMQFTGKVEVTDDSTNEKTVVEVLPEVIEVTLAEYIALGNVVNTDGKLYCITDLNNSDVQGYPPLIYSDEEREVGVWRDGKPLYTKTYTASITANTQWIDTGLDSGDLIVKSEGTLEQNNGQILTLASGDTEAGAGINTFIVGVVTSSKWSCLFRTNNNDARGNLTLTLYYTKGSDVAGSGIWNGQGGLAHHYSTSETVIGTWIDGKPLYEITSRITQDLSLTANTWVKSQFDQGTKKALYKTMIVNDSGAVIDNVAGGFVDNKIAINSPRTLTVLANTGYLIMQYTKTTD